VRADVYRRLLRIASRVGRPGSLLSVGDSGGALLYLEAAMPPVSVIVALDLDDVADLHETLGTWLHEKSAEHREELRAASPLVAGIIARGQLDAASVQSCTVRTLDQHKRSTV
jgi:hypothetical protein